MSQITINDVARAAGVSKRTVTRVMNDEPGAKAETKEKVLAVIEQLGFTPNVLARRLARGLTGIIGVFAYEEVFPVERKNFFYPFLEGIELQAHRLGYDLLLFTQGPRGEERSMFHGNQNRTQIADGLVILGARVNRDDLGRLQEARTPFVCIGRRTGSQGLVNWVSGDYIAGFCQATRHLMELGHSKIAFFGSVRFVAQIDKRSGYRRAMAEAGLAPLELEDEDIGEVGTLVREGRITAIIASEARGIGNIYQDLLEQDLNVPADVSLIGFDKQDTLVNGVQLSYVQMPKEDMAMRAVSLLVDKLGQKEYEDTEQMELPCEFVIGDSLASPK